MIDSLVTKDQSRIDFLKALAKSFARENSCGDRIVKEPWSADYVIGKGSGLIFLLHGKPGVGKTYTAGKPFIMKYTYDSIPSQPPEHLSVLTRRTRMHCPVHQATTDGVD